MKKTITVFKKITKAHILLIIIILLGISSKTSRAAILDIHSTDVPVNVYASGNAFFTTLVIPETVNGYTINVNHTSLGLYMWPIYQIMLFNIGFDGIWYYDDFTYYEGVFNDYHPVPSFAWEDNVVEVKFVTFNLMGVPGATHIENMWLRVFYTLGSDVQAPNGSIEIVDDPNIEDGRFVLLNSNITDNSGQVTGMRWKIDNDDYGPWTSFQQQVSIELPTPDLATVTVQYKDAANNISTFQKSYDPSKPILLTAVPVEKTTDIMLVWQQNYLGFDVVVASALNNVFGTPEQGVLYQEGSLIPGGGEVVYSGSEEQHIHLFLQPHTKYYYKAWSYSNDIKYSTGLTTNATTLNYPPSVFVYAVNQREDGSGLIDVNFVLTGPASTYNVLMEASFDGGNTYAPVPVNHLSGDVEGISPGFYKHIVWNGLASFPETYSTNAKLKIVAIEPEELKLLINEESKFN